MRLEGVFAAHERIKQSGLPNRPTASVSSVSCTVDGESSLKHFEVRSQAVCGEFVR
jgi:hypothetical protein